MPLAPTRQPRPHTPRRRAALPVVPLVVAALLAGCSSSADRKPSAVASPPANQGGALVSSCGDLPGRLSGVSLPKALTPPAGMILYTAGKLGKNSSYQLRRKGAASDAGALLTEALAALEKTGFTVADKQEKVGRAATAMFSGPLRGSLTVAPLCAGQLTIRYSVAP